MLGAICYKHEQLHKAIKASDIRSESLIYSERRIQTL